MFPNMTITIPVIPSLSENHWDAKDTSEKHHKRENVHESKKPRIFVIDDEVLIADTVVEILNGEGFDAMAVSTGAEALELAKENPPDLILSDVIMPGLTGIETGIQMREVAPQCRVILFSGQAATVDLLEKARKNGHSFDILAKPIKPEQLIKVIRATGSRIV